MIRFMAGDSLPLLSDTVTSASGESFSAVDLTGATVYIALINVNKTVGTDSPDLTTTASVVSPASGGKIQFQFTSGQTAMLAHSSGNVYAGEWIVDYNSDGLQTETFPFDDFLSFHKRIRQIL